MTLKGKINDDLKTSMKLGDKIRLETLRMIRAQILEFEKNGSGKDLTVDDELKMLLSAIKKRKESIEHYEKGGRMDLVENEKKEIDIIQSYLPKQMERDEAEKIISRILSEIGSSNKLDLGTVMPVVMKELKGKIEGKIINEIVKLKIT